MVDAAKEQLISANVVGESLSFLKTCNDKITGAIMNALCELIKDGSFILFHTFLSFLKTCKDKITRVIIKALHNFERWKFHSMTTS